VASDPIVYRRTPAFVETHEDEAIAGFIIADSGSLLVALAIEEAAFNHFMTDEQAGVAVLVGIGVYVVGGLIFGHGRRETIRPASHVQFTP
jgi:hypothetical protein